MPIKHSSVNELFVIEDYFPTVGRQGPDRKAGVNLHRLSHQKCVKPPKNTALKALLMI